MSRRYLPGPSKPKPKKKPQTVFLQGGNMTNKEQCPTCIALRILENALKAMPTAHGVYLEYLLVVANKTMRYLDSRPIGRCEMHLNPR